MSADNNTKHISENLTSYMERSILPYHWRLLLHFIMLHCDIGVSKLLPFASTRQSWYCLRLHTGYHSPGIYKKNTAYKYTSWNWLLKSLWRWHYFKPRWWIFYRDQWTRPTDRGTSWVRVLPDWKHSHFTRHLKLFIIVWITIIIL